MLFKNVCCRILELGMTGTLWRNGAIGTHIGETLGQTGLDRLLLCGPTQPWHTRA